MSVSRVQITFTGRPISIDSDRASLTMSPAERRPKPPPRKYWLTVIACGLTLRKAAAVFCTVVCDCVPIQISAESLAGLTEAVRLIGSIPA